MKNKRNPRESAFLVVYRVLEKGEYVTVSLDNEIVNNNFISKDKALLTQIVYGTIKMKKSIDYIINLFLNEDINKLDDYIHAILRISVYQMMYLDRIPVYSVIDEAVKLTKKYRFRLSGLVNAVLRNIDRKRKNISFPNISTELSYPTWMYEKWKNQYNEDFAIEYMKASNENPFTCIKINTLKGSREKIYEQLEIEGFKPEVSKLNRHSIIIKEGAGLLNSKLYKEGYVYLADTSSVVVSKLLDAKPKMKVLDMCSAPGGKTFSIAEDMENTGDIIARDLYENKIKQLSNNSKRLGVKNVTAQIKDATCFIETETEKYDRVLADVPCTNFGIIRRKPDIKWNRKKEDVKELTQIQSEILQNGFSYLKPGGILVYSTCTIDKEENEIQINKFIEKNKYARLIKYNDKNDFLKLYPNIHGTDGFFAVRISKVKR